MNLYLARPLPDSVGYLTQLFGENPADYARFGLAGHNGLDYSVPIGEPVMAAHAGAASVGWDPAGYGNYVRIAGEQCETIYAHLSAVTVRDGATVETGTVIGASGSTGNSTGPHLHWGVKIKGMRNPAYGDWIDPVPFRS